MRVAAQVAALVAAVGTFCCLLHVCTPQLSSSARGRTHLASRARPAQVRRALVRCDRI